MANEIRFYRGLPGLVSFKEKEGVHFSGCTAADCLLPRGCKELKATIAGKWVYLGRMGISFFTTERQMSQRKQNKINSLCSLCLCGEIIFSPPEGC